MGIDLRTLRVAVAFVVCAAMVALPGNPAASKGKKQSCFGKKATIIGPNTLADRPDGVIEPRAKINTIFGTRRSDVIVGTPGEDHVFGYGGDDLICAKGGRDQITADELMGGPIGGKRPGNDRINGGGGADLIVGGTGVQSEDVGDDELLGGGGDDHIEADDGNDEIEGGGGNDALRAGPGDDRVAGGPGDDEMIGAGGNDALLGDDGADSMLGDGISGDPPGFDACDGDSTGSSGDSGEDVVDASCELVVDVP
jgi:Ca2+-binding RTX toxin-like protein